LIPPLEKGFSDKLQVHDTTLPHLDFVEKIILDELIRQGRAEIVSESARSHCVDGVKNVSAVSQ
jgi:hypothetical protein